MMSKTILSAVADSSKIVTLKEQIAYREIYRI